VAEAHIARPDGWGGPAWQLPPGSGHWGVDLDPGGSSMDCIRRNARPRERVQSVRLLPTLHTGRPDSRGSPDEPAKLLVDPQMWAGVANL
jgi:hypothetical protein